MKNRKMSVVVCVLFLAFSVFLMAEPVRVIAVHYGNPEYEEVLSKANYPGFEFYHTDGSEWKYIVEYKAFQGGNPSHLEGLYGDVPEKMGFSASYATEKGGDAPFRYGVIYLIGSNGVIATQTGAYSKFVDEVGLEEQYSNDYNNLRKNLRDIKKAKLPKVLAASKQVYFKTAAVGEYELYKKAEVDKKAAGIIGWNVPEICVFDENGEKHKLPDLVKDENCFVVFYSIDAVKIVEGTRKTGEIVREFYKDIPVNAEKGMAGTTKKAEDGQTLTKEDLGNMFKSMKQSSDNSNSFYKHAIRVLDMAKRVNESVK